MDRSEASSQSKTSFPAQIRNIKQRDILVNIDFFGMAYGTLKLFFCLLLGLLT